MISCRLFTICICCVIFLHLLVIPQINSHTIDIKQDCKKPDLKDIDKPSLISNFITSLNTMFNQKNHLIDANDPSFQPRNLTHSDDAYHNSTKTYATEWWYFDTTFNQDYSLQFGIHIYEIINTGFAQIQCNIYKHGNKIISESTIFPLSRIQLSTDKPMIRLDDQLLMYTKNSSIESSMLHQIKFQGSNYSFDLSFQGTTQGWKGTTNAGDWAVVLPKAIVTGNVSIQNENQSVMGIGYHDHNWNVSFSAGMNFGWLWGKTNSDKYTITWANIFNTWYKQNPLLVINTDYNGYHNVLEEDIDFSITKIEFKNGLITPYGFQLSTQTKDIELSVSIEVIHSDYITVLGLINYWRYHTHATGFLTINNQTIDIDDYNIAEFMRLRPY